MTAIFADYFSAHDVTAIVFPTTPLPAPAIGDDETTPFGNERVSVWTNLRNTGPVTLTGGAGLSLPVGLTSAGLPVGLELDTLPGGDERLLAIALAWEGVTPPLGGGV